MLCDHKTVRVESWRPEARREVYRLLEDGWQIVAACNQRQAGCHDSFIFGNECVVYEMQKNQEF